MSEMDDLKAAGDGAKNLSPAEVAKARKLAQQQRMQATLEQSAAKKAATLEEKQALMADMDISHTSKQVASQEEMVAQMGDKEFTDTFGINKEDLKDSDKAFAGKPSVEVNSAAGEKANSLKDKQAAMADMEVGYTSKQVATQEEMLAEMGDKEFEDTFGIKKEELENSDQAFINTAGTAAVGVAKVEGEAKFQEGVDKAANAFGEQFGDSGAAAFREGVTAVRNGSPEAFAEEQAQALKLKADTAAEAKYQEGLNKAAGKVEEQFGESGGEAFRDGVQAVREGNVDAFVAEQSANLEAKGTDAASSKVEEKFGATAGAASRDGIDAIKNGNTDEFLKDQQGASKARIQGAIDGKIGGEVKSLQDKVSQKLPPQVAAVVNEGIGKISANAAGAISAGAGGLFDKGASGLGDLFKKGGGGGPTAGPPDKLSFAPNLVNKLVIGVGNVFCLQDIVEKLLDIESASGYEAARHAARQMNYTEICDLAHIGDPKNDPNIMPSRFMLIPKADDATLEANSCLDDIPWQVHPDGPQKISVALLQQCLTVMGVIPGELPVWSSSDIEQDADDYVASSTASSPATFDESLKQAFFEYLGASKNKPAQAKMAEQTYTVKRGDTLSAIAAERGYPYWQMIYEANKDTIKNPNLIHEGDKLTLPPLDAKAELDEWYEEKEASASIRRAANYNFPVRYFSMSLLDPNLEALDIETLQEEKPFLFEAYSKQKGHRYLHLSASQHDSISTVIIDSTDTQLGFTDRPMFSPQARLVSFATFKATQEPPEDETQTGQAETVPACIPDGMELVQNDYDNEMDDSL